MNHGRNIATDHVRRKSEENSPREQKDRGRTPISDLLVEKGFQVEERIASKETTELPTKPSSGNRHVRQHGSQTQKRKGITSSDFVNTISRRRGIVGEKD